MSTNEPELKEILQRLQTAKSEQERDWIVLESLLSSLTPELRQAAYAAAIPHWFDADILAALLYNEVKNPTITYQELIKLPFIEKEKNLGGFSVHEIRRAALLKYLWCNQKERYKVWSKKAADYFAQKDSPEWQIEFLYHLFIVNSQEGINQLQKLATKWSNPFDFPLEFYLTKELMEHAKYNRIEGIAKGWIYYFYSDSLQKFYRHVEAKEVMIQALKSIKNDIQLKAYCIFALGNIHYLLIRYGKAKKLYELAKKLFNKSNNLSGEANCIRALADLNLQIDEYDVSRKLYINAIKIYKKLNFQIEKASCIHALGDIYLKQNEFNFALKLYEKAKEINIKIGDRISWASCIQSIGDVFLKKEKLDHALKYYEEAKSIFEEIGARIGEANCYLSIGNIKRLIGNYEKAEELYNKALITYRQFEMPYSVAYTLRKYGDLISNIDNIKSLQFYEESFNLLKTIGMNKEANELCELIENQKIKINALQKSY